MFDEGVLNALSNDIGQALASQFNATHLRRRQYDSSVNRHKVALRLVLNFCFV